MTGRTFPTAARLALAALVLHLVLVQPNHPAAATWEALLLFPLELPVILLGLAALGPGRAGLAARAVLVAALVVIAVLKTADFAAFSALSRGFNPVADLPLVEASVRLLAGTVGGLAAAGIVVAALAAVGLLAAALWWATGVWSRAGLPPVARRAAGLVAVLAAGVATAEIADALRAWKSPVAIPGAAFTARVGIERVDMAARTFADLRVFRAAAAADPLTGRSGLLDAIDRDVIVIFVESYGRTSIDTPYYAEVHRATLERSAERLGQLGLAMRSGFALAPTRGGQSWLSHATLMNGLWIDDQARYGAALASGRETLFHIAARSGFRTAAVMPAITLDWPESAFMGFETVLAAADLGYRGKPFNWVTMPDQFTLAALDRLLRSGGDERPLFAQVALVSSHAPWVPVPTLLDWDALGDGRVFDEVATSGDPPDVVWRDRDRVREQYRLAVDYALRTVFDYAARHAEDPPLLLIVGDHQAAGFVALDERPDVPVHLVGPPDLVARAAAWGWSEGLVPSPATEPFPMDALRDLFVRTFTDGTDDGDAS
jgi:energy-converting hydrogenase Eha subunit A